jgi:hypothetical protein
MKQITKNNHPQQALLSKPHSIQREKKLDLRQTATQKQIKSN